MGAVKKIVGGIFGGAEKPKALPAPKQEPVEPQKSPAETAAEDEQKQKAALIALNQGSTQPQGQLGGGDANVTRKVLLGL